MTLNQNFAGTALSTRRRKLEGSDRGLDALVGLVVLVAELLIGFLSVYALYLYGVAASETTTSTDAIQTGFAIALFGSIAIFGVTTLVYLVRMARGRRSWTAPLWGLILISATSIIGYLVMGS